MALRGSESDHCAALRGLYSRLTLVVQRAQKATGKRQVALLLEAVQLLGGIKANSWYVRGRECMDQDFPTRLRVTEDTLRSMTQRLGLCG